MSGQSLNLPQTIIQPTVAYSTGASLPAFVAVEFTSFPSDYDVSAGTYMGWSAKSTTQLIVWPSHESRWIFRYQNGKPIYDTFVENTAKYRMYNTYPNPIVFRSDEWPCVNWILNHKNGENGRLQTTVIDIQEAIWYLLEGQYHDEAPFTRPAPYRPSAAARGLVEDAQRLGAHYEPRKGEVVGILLHGVSQPGLTGPPHDLIIEASVL